MNLRKFLDHFFHVVVKHRQAIHTVSSCHISDYNNEWNKHALEISREYKYTGLLPSENILKQIPINSEQSPITFDFNQTTYNLKEIYDGTHLCKVIITTDEKFGVTDGLKDKVKKMLNEMHPDYKGLTIEYKIN